MDTSNFSIKKEIEKYIGFIYLPDFSDRLLYFLND